METNQPRELEEEASRDLGSPRGSVPTDSEIAEGVCESASIEDENSYPARTADSSDCTAIAGEASTRAQVLTGDKRTTIGPGAGLGGIFSGQSLLTDEQVATARSLFKELDARSTGILNPGQIPTLLTILGYRVTEEEMHHALNEYDAEYENGLNEDDVIRLIEEMETNAFQKKQLLEAFALMDVDSSGIIEVARLQALLCGAEGGGADDVPDPLSESEFAYFMLEARAMKDGRFDYKKFVNDLLFSKVPIEPVGGRTKGKGKKKKK
ncbi:EF hand domain-containing protein [Besnoitia besnoiti]|uniref:Calmodulin n=1 Tax=Besnoitia besnoiti TaxID=94643 RepID=A0A2A9M711_BESBE|nr:EF hand domain-containing protein [Besnoitia besnoiti]PFH32984.1 EF hand domain-containing protein [Besnoitia besnoiti]